MRKPRAAAIAVALTTALAAAAGCSADGGASAATPPPVGTVLTRGELASWQRANADAAEPLVHVYDLGEDGGIVVSPDEPLPADVVSDIAALDGTESLADARRIRASIAGSQVPMFLVHGADGGFVVAAYGVDGLEPGPVADVGLHDSADAALSAARALMAAHPGARVVVDGVETTA